MSKEVKCKLHLEAVNLEDSFVCSLCFKYHGLHSLDGMQIKMSVTSSASLKYIVNRYIHDLAVAPIYIFIIIKYIAYMYKNLRKARNRKQPVKIRNL